MLLLSVLLVELVLLSIQKSQAFFTDTALSTANSFTAANEFPTSVPPSSTPTLTDTPTPSLTPTPTSSPTPTPTPNILINELSSAGSSSQNEWIEIFNRTGSSIDVSGWKIADATSFDSIPSVSPIPANGYGVIITDESTVLGLIPSSAITIQLQSSDIGSGLNNTGDAVYLRNSTNFEVDSMSYGNNSTIFSGIPTPGVGQSLIRDPNGTDSDTSSDWKLDSSPSIGEANSL